MCEERYSLDGNDSIRWLCSAYKEAGTLPIGIYFLFREFYFCFISRSCQRLRLAYITSNISVTDEWLELMWKEPAASSWKYSCNI
jgi:hypothetical protein